MKKLTGILLCIIVLVCSIVLPNVVFASDDIMVDVDTQTLVDKSGNNVTLTQKGTITTGSFTNQEGEIVHYMTTGTPTSMWGASDSGAFRITDTSITQLKDFTIELWARYRKPTVEVSPRIFTQRIGTKVLLGYEVGGTPSRPHKIVWCDGNSMVGITNGDQMKDEWHHYVFTYDTIYGADGTTITGAMPILYIDGVQKVKPGNPYSGANLSYIGTADAFSLCGDTTADNHVGFPGDVATARIYNSVKTAAQVSELYNVGKDRFVESNVSAETITFDDGGLVAGASNIEVNMPDIKVQFNDDTDMSTVTKDTLKLTDETDGLEIDYTISTEGTVATISCADVLGKNKEYSVTLTDAIKCNDTSTYGQFRARFSTIRGAYAVDGWSLSKSGNIITASLTAKSDNVDGDTAEHILAIYQICDGYVLPVKTVSASDTATSGSDLTISEDLSALPNGEYQAFSMLWGTDLEIYENQPKALEFTIE